MVVVVIFLSFFVAFFAVDGVVVVPPFPSQMDLSLVPMLVKSWDSLMGKCLAQHLELQMDPLMVLMNLCLALMKASYLFS